MGQLRQRFLTGSCFGGRERWTGWCQGRTGSVSLDADRAGVRRARGPSRLTLRGKDRQQARLGIIGRPARARARPSSSSAGRPY